MSGKGDKQRQSQVSDHQMSENWQRAFGNKPEKGCKKKVRKPK